MKKLLKREIKELIENNEIIDFFSVQYNGDRIVDRIKNKGNGNFSIHSSGNGWTDQAETTRNLKTIVKMVWSNRPYNAV